MNKYESDEGISGIHYGLRLYDSSESTTVSRKKNLLSHKEACTKSLFYKINNIINKMSDIMGVFSFLVVSLDEII